MCVLFRRVLLPLVNAGMGNLLKKGQCLEGNPLGKGNDYFTIYGIRYLWKPPRIFINFPEPQIMDSHKFPEPQIMDSQKKSFNQTMDDQHLIFLCLAPKRRLSNKQKKTCLAQASRSTKNSPDLPLHQYIPVGKNRAPIPPPGHRNWPNVLNQLRAIQYLSVCLSIYLIIYLSL